jgi:hypothetical protein
MGFLIFGAGVFGGMLLGIVLFSPLAMAQEAEALYELRGWGEAITIPEDTHYLSPSDSCRLPGTRSCESH